MERHDGGAGEAGTVRYKAWEQDDSGFECGYKLGQPMFRAPEEHGANAEIELHGNILTRNRLILQDDVERVNDSGDVTEDCQQDVDEEVGATATLEEDTDGREDDGKEDLADVAAKEQVSIEHD